MYMDLKTHLFRTKTWPCIFRKKFPLIHIDATVSICQGKKIFPGNEKNSKYHLPNERHRYFYLLQHENPN